MPKSCFKVAIICWNPILIKRDFKFSSQKIVFFFFLRFTWINFAVSKGKRKTIAYSNLLTLNSSQSNNQTAVTIKGPQKKASIINYVT